jgi:hypothetical protein
LWRCWRAPRAKGGASPTPSPNATTSPSAGRSAETSRPPSRRGGSTASATRWRGGPTGSSGGGRDEIREAGGKLRGGCRRRLASALDGLLIRQTRPSAAHPGGRPMTPLTRAPGAMERERQDNDLQAQKPRPRHTENPFAASLRLKRFRIAHIMQLCSRTQGWVASNSCLSGGGGVSARPCNPV